MSGPASANLPIAVAPGQTVDISVDLTSPGTAGTYTGNWKLKNNNGVAFGLCPFGNCFLGNQKAFWVKINVAGTGIVPPTLTPTGTGTATPTSTSTSTPTATATSTPTATPTP
jgi:hypothetical protein